MTLTETTAKIATLFQPLTPEQQRHLAVVIEGMLTKSFWEDEANGDPIPEDEVAYEIRDGHFNDWSLGSGWIRRDGFLMPAGFTKHERLLYFIGVLPVDAEDQGWARMGKTGWQCVYRLSPEQRRVLTRHGFAVDRADEAAKSPWHGLPPYDEAVHPARRVPR